MNRQIKNMRKRLDAINAKNVKRTVFDDANNDPITEILKNIVRILFLVLIILTRNNFFSDQKSNSKS
jgi:hypothetical protein